MADARWTTGKVGRLMLFFFSSRRRHTRCLSDWSSTCALPISPEPPRASGRPEPPRAALLLAGDLGHELRHLGRLLSLQQIGGHHALAEALLIGPLGRTLQRSEERRVGKGCRSRGSPEH